MESSNTELNRATSLPVKHEHDTTALAHLKTHPSEKRITPSSSSKSSSPPSPLDDHPLHNDDGDVDDKSSSSSTASSPSHKSDKIPENEKSVPLPEQSVLSPVNESATEAPPAQEMERSPSAYRIPSSVFERSKSSTPMEWSVASNESLFSIHMGNMSFTNDYFFWRSGDLGPPAEASTSDQMFSYSVDEAAGGMAADMRRSDLGIAEATMLEVIKESEGQSHETTLAEVRNARRSEGSNHSNKSFAFSIVGGDTGSSARMPSSVRSNQVQSQSQSQPMTKPEPQPEPENLAETGNGAKSNWFSCFSCCSV